MQVRLTLCVLRSKGALLTGVLYCDRDHADNPEGIIYELAGESVVPGIDCQNVESIFEEHTLCSQLDPSAAMHNVYAISERRFEFGAVLAAVGGSAPHAGVKANLKFTNVFKVGCQHHAHLHL